MKCCVDELAPSVSVAERSSGLAQGDVTDVQGQTESENMGYGIACDELSCTYVMLSGNLDSVGNVPGMYLHSGNKSG